MSMKLSGRVKRFEKEITIVNGDSEGAENISVDTPGLIIDGVTRTIILDVPEMDGGSGTCQLEIKDEDNYLIYDSTAKAEKAVFVAQVQRPITPGMHFRVIADTGQTADRVIKVVLYYE